MKKTLILTTAFVLCVCITMCKKSDSTKNTATCTTCSSTPVSHTPDSAVVYYYLPTAFTPNGDGINDIERLFFNGLDTNNSTITIWNLSGTEVFTGKIDQRWNGYDLSGARCAAGEYPVYLQLKTTAGAAYTACACVNILAYSAGCINTHGITYYFPDQLDSAGFVYPTNETLCP